MGAVWGGSIEGFNSDLGLMGRVVSYTKRLGAMPFFSFCLNIFSATVTITVGRKRKSLAFVSAVDWMSWTSSQIRGAAGTP